MNHQISIEFTDDIPVIDTNASSSVLVSSPEIKIYPGTEPTVRWVFGGTMPAWQMQAPTYVIGMVIQKPDPAPPTMPAVNDLFNKYSSDCVFTSATWAGPSGQPNQDSAFLFLSHGLGWTLKIQSDAAFSSQGDPLASHFSYPYRIYFFSAGIGVWHQDPELDVEPDPGPPDPPIVTGGSS